MAAHQQAPAQAPAQPDYGNIADLADFAGAVGEATGYDTLGGIGAMVKGGATYKKESGESNSVTAGLGAAGGIGGALGMAGEALGSATSGMGYGMGTLGEWGGWALGKAGGALAGAGNVGGIFSGTQEWLGGTGEDSRLGGLDALGNALSLGGALAGTAAAGTTAAAAAPFLGAAGLGTGLYVGAHKLNNMTGGAMWDPASSPLATAASGISGAASSVYSAVTDYDYLGIGDDIGF